MRKELAKIAGVRQRFTATFVRYGSKKSFKGAPIKTLLFENVSDKYGKEFCDHIWFTINKQFKNLNLEGGDKISFDARVKSYTKGYRGRKEYDEEAYDPKPITNDFKLSHPNNIVKSGTNAGTLFSKNE